MNNSGSNMSHSFQPSRTIPRNQNFAFIVHHFPNRFARALFRICLSFASGPLSAKWQAKHKNLSRHLNTALLGPARRRAQPATDDRSTFCSNVVHSLEALKSLQLVARSEFILLATVWCGMDKCRSIRHVADRSRSEPLWTCLFYRLGLWWTSSPRRRWLFAGGGVFRGKRPLLTCLL